MEQKLKSMVDSLDSERKFLRQRVVDLTNQLETAQKTISSLENINVPSLIRELLKNPFDSKDVLEHLSNPQTLPTQSVTNQSNRAQEFKDSHSFDETGEESVFEWLGTGQSSSGQSFSKQPATAFLPWKNDPWAGPDPLEVKGSDTLPFSVTDDVSIYKAMADAKSSTHQAHPFGKNTEFHSVAMATHSCVDVPPNPFNLKEMRLRRETGGDIRDEGPVTVRKDPYDFNYLTAQRMLEDFFSQIPPPALDGKEKDRLGAREKKEGNY
ncbi:uncharacterized protein LOC130564180 [Triplophysa rosa]|nr:uncharacterized protein LOC130564180 [Triplophysa rosa]